MYDPRRWEDMVLYQVYPRSFADSDGDGVGDLRGVIDSIGYLEHLGVDGVWLNPIMRSPGADHGYDVSDPRSVDPLFGDNDDLRTLADALHSAGMVLIMDLVPNHTSIEHPWFAEALAGGSGSRARERYHFRDGRGPGGDSPPNNWPSVFGGPAWTRTSASDGRGGQWYLHLFAPDQPDLNWAHSEVASDLERTLRFWLDLGVDGFRIDVAHGMAKPAGLPDIAEGAALPQLIVGDDELRFDQPGVHDIHRRIRAVLDEYPHSASFGELWVGRTDRFAAYLRPDELHFAFNFLLAEADFRADDIRSAIESSLEAADVAGVAPTWALANHDIDREVSRYGGGEVGAARSRAMLLVMLALPGIPFLYYGEELGLPSDYTIPADRLTDPRVSGSGGGHIGRDNCRVPMPWRGTRPPYGFSTTSDTWLPMPEGWGSYTVENQYDDPASTFTLVRRAIELRRGFDHVASTTVTFVDAPEGCLGFTRPDGVLCLLNASDTDVRLADADLLLASTEVSGRTLPPNAAAWIEPVDGARRDDN